MRASIAMQPSPTPPTLISGIPDWVNELGLVATFIGLLISVVGLVATYRQAKGAKDAAVAARDAVANMENINSSSDLGYATSQLTIVRSLVAAEGFHAAQMVFQSVKRTSVDTFTRLKTQENLSAEVATAHKALSAIETQMDFGIQGSTSYSVGVLTKGIRGLSDFLIAQESAIKHNKANQIGA